MNIYNITNSFLLSVVLILCGVAADDVHISKNQEWCSNSNDMIFEYTSNANPHMTEIPVKIFPPELHESGSSKVVPFDLSDELQVEYPATSPNLLANFVRVVEGESFPTSVKMTTSQVFYVIRGNGSSVTRNGTVNWTTGDLFVIPFFGDELLPICNNEEQCVLHSCSHEPQTGGCALYWVNDSPLLHYLGVRPLSTNKPRFIPSFFTSHEVLGVVNGLDSINLQTGKPNNRRGVLFGNKATEQTKTLTPSLWSLLNVIKPEETQRAHKHNSVALDLAVDVVSSINNKVWTAMGPEIDLNGEIIEPINVEWRAGGVFVTPPGWWHSHHNMGKQEAWVLPIQDAGLYTHQRTLDIRFADEEALRLKSGRNRGATLMQ